MIFTVCIISVSSLMVAETKNSNSLSRSWRKKRMSLKG